MGVQKLLNGKKGHSRVNRVGSSSEPVGIQHCKKKKSKSRRKKIILKSSARDQVVQLLRPLGEKKKKVLHIKKKFTVGKRLLSEPLKSVPPSPSKKIDEWLGNLDGKKSQSEDSQILEALAGNTSTNAISEEQKAYLREDSNMTSTAEASFIDQYSIQPERSSSESSDVIFLEDGCLKSTDMAASQLHSSKIQNELLHPSKINKSTSEKLCEPNLASVMDSNEENTTPTMLDIKGLTKQDPDSVSKLRCIIKRPLTVSKRVKSKKKYRRKEFLKFCLQQSHGGYQLAMKKFLDKKLTRSLKPKHAGSAESTPLAAKNYRDAENAPLKVVVKERLSSSGVAQSMGSLRLESDAATPREQKILSRLNLASHEPKIHSVVSCEVPYESSFDGCSPDKEKCHAGSSHTINANEVDQASKREVCYIFALLDREKEETLFKCSPHVKSSKVLEKLASVIDTIYSDEDLMFSRKIHPTDDLREEHSDGPALADQSTSPIVLPSKPFEEYYPIADPLNEEENSDDSGMQSDMEKKGRVVSAFTKAIISKALLSFTSELKVLFDVSVRLLGWCSGSIKADLDSDSFEDEFEGFLCHCHDKVSILIECVSVLDSQQILNLDEDELRRFWLLHDALRCMLQAYRYTQSPSASGHLSQKLLSLIMTCSKTILPSVNTPLSRWVSLMTMISGISTKLCEARLLSNACLCYQHFESLQRGRSCGVCDLKSFYREVCKAEPSNLKCLKNKCDTTYALKMAVEQLFPRFCWFINEVEGLSKEEFMTALQKHSVVKFSCNAQSGLYPCVLHLSDIACSCFASSTDVEPLSVVQTEAQTISENASSTDTHNIVLNESSDQQIVPLCVEAAEDGSLDTRKCIGENLSSEDGQNIASEYKSRVSASQKAVEVPADSSTASEETVILSNNGSQPHEPHKSNCEVVSLDGSPSEEFSLHLEESSCNPGLQSCNITQLERQGSDNGTVALDMEESSCTSRPQQHVSQSHKLLSNEHNIPEHNQSLQSLYDTDMTVSLSSSISVDSNKLCLAQSNCKSAILDDDSGSIVSVDSQSSLPRDSPNEDDLMRDVSTGDDGVFESSFSVGLKGHTSMATQMGSESSASADESHSSHGTKDNRTRRLLKSPPPCNVVITSDNEDSSQEDHKGLQESPPPINNETTLKDAVFSVEVAGSSGSVLGHRRSSTQEKDFVVQKLASQNDFEVNSASTHSKKTDQFQRLKEDHKQRLHQAWRSKLDDDSLLSETSNSYRRSIRTRKQHSSGGIMEKISVGRETNETDSTPMQSSINQESEDINNLEKSVNDKQALTDRKKLESDEPRIKRSDKRVTFNDIQDILEFKNEPILGYGRRIRVPENFVSDFKQKMNSFINTLYENSQTFDEDLSTESEGMKNVEVNNKDAANVASTCVETDCPKSKNRKLSLQSSKTAPIEEMQMIGKRATRSDTRTNAASDKLRQINMLDEKYRMAFDPQMNEERDTASSLGNCKSKPRTKRTITDVEEDASKKVDEAKIVSKSAKKSRPSESKALDDAVPKNATNKAPMVIKSCLRKTNQPSPQIETKFAANKKLVQGLKENLRKLLSEEDQEVDMMETDSERIPEQDKDFKRVKRATRRMQKKSEEPSLQEEVISTTDQHKVSLMPDDANPSSFLPEMKKSKKRQKVEQSKECTKRTALKMFKTKDIEEKETGATRKRKGSKKSKSLPTEDDSEGIKSGKNCDKDLDLNVSDPPWYNVYLADFEGRYFKN